MDKDYEVKYEGFVEEICEDGEVYLRMYDLDDKTSEEEWVFENGIDEFLTEEEKPYYDERAIFTWAFYKDYNKLEFLKEKWTKEEIDRIKEEAERLSKALKWD